MQSFRPKVMCIGIVCIERRCLKSTIQKILDRIVQILVAKKKNKKISLDLCSFEKIEIPLFQFFICLTTSVQ